MCDVCVGCGRGQRHRKRVVRGKNQPRKTFFVVRLLLNRSNNPIEKRYSVILNEQFENKFPS